MRLLLIEDDPGISLVLGEVLVSEGYDVVLTAYAEAQHWDRADFGLTAILTKPFDLDPLLAAINAQSPELSHV